MKKREATAVIIDVVAERRTEGRKRKFIADLRSLVCELLGTTDNVKTIEIMAGICRGEWPKEMYDKEREAVVRNMDNLLLKLETDR